MKKQEAIQIVNSTFSGKFNEIEFKKFISNLLKQYSPNDFEPRIRDAYKEFILKYKIIGSFEDAQKKKIDILQVILSGSKSLDRARTAQRNFVSDYLKRQGRDAALVAFISPNEEDWRFSLVKLEYTLEAKDGKIKTNEEITPARRWSFLIGKNEGKHTVQSRFISLLEHDVEPTLEELEEAFNIEKVTNEFFAKYCDLFLRMKDSLDSLLEKDVRLKKDFQDKELSTVDFAKKTLGQMAFLYFIQKKGWFGVAPDEEWGSGPKNFLRELFNRREKYGNNFFDDVLEPLFYTALAVDRGKESLYDRLNNCRMPFLNGGLFEPMNGYSWETTHIKLPDELFSNSNKDTKTGDIGDGILDVFDRYNFTVNENEPLEKEVAVDPEMLGKVFENLLEIKDRKSKGAFYTPREIVHYMCQECLINYLNSETDEKLPREDIEILIRSGIQIIQNDQIVLKRGKENLAYRFMLPESIRSSVQKLDELLANIKVCDPAVGSGAFPLGMLNEIVRARQVLSVHLKRNISPYDLKLHSISNSIYGVDIDPGAVEIAKLRLWLALVVEENKPHPLPNLDHKIMQGNSLISEYEGIKLFDETLLEQKERKQVQIGMNFGSSADIKLEKLQLSTEEFINESQRSKKQELKERIDDLKWELIEATLDEQGRKDKLDEIKTLRRKNIKPFFLWKLEFSDVFKEKGGFDVVIGNPPYITYKGKQKVNVSDEEIRYYIETYKNSAEYKINSYALFVERAFPLLKKEGVMSYIIPSTILQNEYLEKIRKYILENYHIDLLVTFGNHVFQAVTDSIILQCSKRRSNDETKTLRKLDLEFSNNLKFVNWLQDDWLKNNDGVINLKTSKFENKILIHIEQDSENLDLFFNANIGIKRANASIETTKISDKHKRFIVGGELSRFLVIWKGNFILFDQKFFHTGVDEKIFLQKEKILVRKTGNVLIASYDSSQFYTDQSIYNIYPKNDVKDFSLKYLCALLNAKVLNWYFNKKMITNADVFPYIKGIHLKKLPIKKIFTEAQKPFIELVDQILEISSAPDYNPKNPPVKQKELEKQIDELVYRLYDLTDEEIKIIEHSTQNNQNN